MSERYTDEQKDEVVRLYDLGMKGEDIAQQVGVPRPTIYLWLRDRGKMPSRQKVMQSRQLSPQQLVEQLGAAQREIGKLEGEVASLRSQIQFMLSQKNGVESGSD